MIAHAKAWACLVTAQRLATADGREAVSLADMLSGLLLEDGSGLVPQALRESGFSMPSVTPPVNGSVGLVTVRQSREVEIVTERACSEAALREHIHVEPGHVLLAMANDPTCAGHHLLLDAGADTDRLCDLLVEQLPTSTVDEASLRRGSERLPRLTAEQTDALTAQVWAWRAAIKTLREDPAVGPGERHRLEQVLDRTSGAVMRLQRHHLYLAWAAAEQCGDRGHDVAFCYDLAHKLLTGACLAFAPSETTSFKSYAWEHIAEGVAELIGCDIDASTDLEFL